MCLFMMKVLIGCLVPTCRELRIFDAVIKYKKMKHKGMKCSIEYQIPDIHQNENNPYKLEFLRHRSKLENPALSEQLRLELGWESFGVGVGKAELMGVTCRPYLSLQKVAAWPPSSPVKAADSRLGALSKLCAAPPSAFYCS